MEKVIFFDELFGALVGWFLVVVVRCGLFDVTHQNGSLRLMEIDDKWPTRCKKKSQIIITKCVCFCLLFFSLLWLLLWCHTEPETDAQVHSERDGVAVHRRAEIIHQFTDGQFRVSSCQQRLDGFTLRPPTFQTIQRQRVSQHFVLLLRRHLLFHRPSLLISLLGKLGNKECTLSVYSFPCCVFQRGIYWPRFAHALPFFAIQRPILYHSSEILCGCSAKMASSTVLCFTVPIVDRMVKDRLNLKCTLAER